ncbi:hypothetical protein BDV93DRAFT_609406 [Ceratobasidium sp. AG-I]|nr:hypothetical protein BDV93DRAFT_609406 [Ceratobasidium sp. AG-I]
MLFKRLSAWITDKQGMALPEHQIRIIDDNTIECWIPSEEGTKFEISWKAEKDVQPGLDLRCAVYLDGIAHNGSFTRATGVANGRIGTKQGQTCGDSLIRPYTFGKRKLTDDETIAPLGLEVEKDLNTIRLELSWGRVGPPRLWEPRDGDVETKPLHEKMAKKGHSECAELGKPVADPRSLGVSYPFHAIPDSKPVAFIFRYASQDWLQAREIVPFSQNTKVCYSPKSSSTNKRPRIDTPDIIDIDDLESDEDDVVVLKHLAPVTTPPHKRPRKMKGEWDAQPKLGL